MPNIKSMDDLKRLSKLMDVHGEEEGMKKYQEEEAASPADEGAAEGSKGPQLNPKKVKSFVAAFSK